MFDINGIKTKIATKLGLSVTILVLLAACSSKEIVNEASDVDHANYTDTAADQNPYVDQSELPVREQEEREVKKVKRSTVKKFKKKSARKPIAKKDRVELESFRGERPADEKLSDLQLQEATLPAIGSIDNSQTPTPPAPPVDGLMADQSMDQPLFESETSTDYSGLILENWHFLLMFLSLGLASWIGFKVFQKRFWNRRKSKRRLVFN